jgi:type III secretion HrpO family protein
MTPETIGSIANEALYLILLLSLPLVGVAALVGILFGLLQALTQLQDQTTTFALKLVVIFGLLVVLLPWMGVQLHSYGERLLTMIVEVR